MTEDKDAVKMAFDTFLKEVESGEIDVFQGKNIWELTDKSCRFENWKQYISQFKTKLDYARQNDILLAALEDCWDETNYHDYNREDYYDFGESPLEILSYCMGDLLTYPPPEILQAIVSQFCYYMAMEGEVSLEEAFFDSPKGKGAYSTRRAKENDLFKRFDEICAYSRHEGRSQMEIIEGLVNAPHLSMLPLIPKMPNPFNNLEENTDLESFLRGYRRWKKRHDK